MDNNKDMHTAEKIRADDGKRTEVYPGIRLYLTREQRFFGKGPYDLLRLVEQENSLKAACVQMRISYSKGWKMVTAIEEQLCVKIVDRRRGGMSRGQSVLTETGKELLSRYQAYAAESQTVIEDLFQKHFAAWLQELNSQPQEKKC